MTRLFLWGHLLTVATNDDTNVLDASFVLTDNKLNELANFASPVKAPEGDHIDLVRLRTPEDLRSQWDAAAVWEDVARDGMEISLVDYYVDLAIKDLLEENGLEPEDVTIHVVGTNTEQLIRIMEASMPKTFERVQRDPINTSSLVSAFRFFLPSLLGPKDEAFLQKQNPHRAVEIVDAQINAFNLLMHRVPSNERFARKAPGAEQVLRKA